MITPSKTFNQALKIDPNDAHAYNNRGIAYRRTKASMTAPSKTSTRPSRLDPDYADAYNNRGSCLRGTKASMTALSGLRPGYQT